MRVDRQQFLRTAGAFVFGAFLGGFGTQAARQTHNAGEVSSLQSFTELPSVEGLQEAGSLEEFIQLIANVHARMELAGLTDKKANVPEAFAFGVSTAYLKITWKPDITEIQLSQGALKTRTGSLPLQIVDIVVNEKSIFSEQIIDGELTSSREYTPSKYWEVSRAIIEAYGNNAEYHNQMIKARQIEGY